jgi:hypothetical protein
MPMPILSLLSPVLPLSLLLPMLFPSYLKLGKLDHLYLDLSALGGNTIRALNGIQIAP